MDLNQLDSAFYVTGQIGVADIERLAEFGIRAIINNRPDGETPDQPSNAELAARAKSLGIEWRYAPIRSRVPEDDELAAYGAALDDLVGPVCAFCRTGTRSAIGWQALQSALDD